MKDEAKKPLGKPSATGNPVAPSLTPANPSDAAANPATPEGEKKTIRRSKKKTVVTGSIYVRAGFNNTLISITDGAGNVIAQSSSGACGFKGSKKGTPFAAQMAAEAAAEKAKVFGFEKADIYVKGVGHGREQALRGLIAQGISILKIVDTTPVPHNGCRQPRTRRV